MKHTQSLLAHLKAIKVLDDIFVKHNMSAALMCLQLACSDPAEIIPGSVRSKTIAEFLDCYSSTGNINYNALAQIIIDLEHDFKTKVQSMGVHINPAKVVINDNSNGSETD